MSNSLPPFGGESCGRRGFLASTPPDPPLPQRGRGGHHPVTLVVHHSVNDRPLPSRGGVFWHHESHFKGWKQVRFIWSRMCVACVNQGARHLGRERSERQMRRDYVTFISIFDAALSPHLPSGERGERKQAICFRRITLAGAPRCRAMSGANETALSAYLTDIFFFFIIVFPLSEQGLRPARLRRARCLFWRRCFSPLDKSHRVCIIVCGQKTTVFVS